jgi:hypothetical protein
MGALTGLQTNESDNNLLLSANGVRGTVTSPIHHTDNLAAGEYGGQPGMVIDVFGLVDKVAERQTRLPHVL